MDMMDYEITARLPHEPRRMIVRRYLAILGMLALSLVFSLVLIGISLVYWT